MLQREFVLCHLVKYVPLKCQSVRHDFLEAEDRLLPTLKLPIENIAREYRNSEIYRDYKKGMTYHVFSQKYKLSSVTIRNVVKYEMEKRKAVSK